MFYARYGSFIALEIMSCPKRSPDHALGSAGAAAQSGDALTWLARWFDWRQTLIIVPPATFFR
jgi:hypothetical protein